MQFLFDYLTNFLVDRLTFPSRNNFFDKWETNTPNDDNKLTLNHFFKAKPRVLVFVLLYHLSMDILPPKKFCHQKIKQVGQQKVGVDKCSNQSTKLFCFQQKQNSVKICVKIVFSKKKTAFCCRCFWALINSFKMGKFESLRIHKIVLFLTILSTFVTCKKVNFWTFFS